MLAPSSPSLPPRNPRNPQIRLGAPPREKHLRTPPSTVQRRRTEIAPIGVPAKRRVAFWKRREGLFSKASALYQHTGARAAVFVFSSTGKLHSSDDLSVEETAAIIFCYVRHNDGAMQPMGPKEGVDRVKKEGKCFSDRFKTISKKGSELCTKTHARAAVIVFSKTGILYAWGFPTVEDVISDWVEKQLESCVTEEDFGTLNLNYEPFLHYVMGDKLKDISGSGNSGVGVDRGSEVSQDDDFDSRAQSFEASHPVLFTDLKDHASDGLLTSPVNSAVASGSSGEEPMRSVLVGCEFNHHSSLNLSENNPSVKAGAGGHSGAGVGHDDAVLYDDETNWILSLPEIFEATCPSLLDDFGNCNRNGDSNSFLTSPVNSAVAGGSSGVESTPMCSDLGDCESDPNKYLNLSEDFVHDGFLISPEKSTFDGGSSGEGPPRSDLDGYDYDPHIFSPT